MNSGEEHHDLAPEPARLDLNENDRLPWLESEDDDEYLGVDTRKVAIAVAGGLGLLGAVVGGLWYATHHRDTGAPLADGSVIAAPSEPAKEAPKDPGGKQFDGTGDTSFGASQGQTHQAQLAAPTAGANMPGAQPAAQTAQAAANTAAAVSAAAGQPAPEAKPAPKPATADETTGPAGGVVQIAAYSSHALAETGWNRLVTSHDILKGMNHRIVAATIEMGTVYRLQLVTNAGGGRALCERLKADGLPCQVKH